MTDKKSTRGDKLWDEIVADPSNDHARDVYADQLEQDGAPDRANLIRLQLRRASLPAWDAQVVGLELQERALLAEHEDDWLRPLPSHEDIRWGQFTRGFVGTVAFDEFELFAKYIDACVTATPIQHVVLRWPTEPKPPKLAAIPTLRELTMVGTVMRPEDLKWLASCPLLSTIRTINLIEADLGSGLANLLKSPHLGKLEVLRLPGHSIGNSGLKKLIGANLPNLVELDLSTTPDQDDGGGGSNYNYGRRYNRSTSITSKGMLEFQSWQGLANIRTLDLSGCKLGKEGMLMLLASVNSRGLRTLRIRGIKDGEWDLDDSLSAFKHGPAGTLEELDIGNNDLDPEGAHFMAEGKACRELKVLRMDDVRSSAFDRVAKGSWVRTSLRVLACSGEALPHFIARRPEQLHTVKITSSAAPLSKFARQLAGDPPPALRVLDLSSARIDEDGLRQLGQASFPALQALLLPHARTGFTNAMVGVLAKSKLGKQVTSFDAGQDDVDRLPVPEPIDIGLGDYEGPHRFI